MKALFFAHFEAGDQWPEGFDKEQAKYYRRTYINSSGLKHNLYLAWRQEWVGVADDKIRVFPGRKVI